MKKLIMTALLIAALVCSGHHKAQIRFFLSVKKAHPEFFSNVSVLDVGSLDINGNNRMFFTDYTYTGLDIGPGPNVDTICPVHRFRGQYDVVICSNMLEHDKYYHKSLKRMVKLVRPGGLLLISAAAEGRTEHGTAEHSPESSPYTNEYYMNMTPEIFNKALKPEDNFSEYECYKKDYDVFFWGIKK